MSSREPLWFCHECNAEMRPLMMPDPHCASCNGTFVEKMENPEDDPRQYQQHMPGDFDEAYPPGMNDLIRLFGLTRQLDHDGRPPVSGPERTSLGSLGRGTRIELTSGRNGNTRVISVGGANTLGRPSEGPSGEVPTMSQFLRRGPEARMPGGPDRAAITGPLMAQYLMALLGSQRPSGVRGGIGGDPFADLLFGGLGTHEGEGGNGSGNGRWGDYVFNQEALDQIITQLMESANSGRPVPATDEIIENLPREVLEEGSPRLQQDCAVCKDSFKLETDDPDEQVVVTLPCTHPFHEGCILPWIKSSGTCPVCRHALVPQPEHHPPGPGPAGASGSSPGGPTSRSSDPSHADTGRGFFNSFFSSTSSGQSGGAGGNRRTAGTGTRANSDPSPFVPVRRRQGSGRGQDFPGGWGEQVD